MTRCPSCFQALPDDRFRWVCVSGRCAPIVDAEASRYAGHELRQPPIMQMVKPEKAENWQPPRGATHRDCGGEAARACPFCNYRLPDNWYGSETLCVALSGGRYSGKSVFIGVLIHCLEDLAERLGSALTFADPVSRSTYRNEYEAVLFEQMGVMDATPSASTSASYQRHPLVLNLGRVNGRLLHVVIRDVAGEDLESPPSNARTTLGFFRHADLVTFLVDPLAVQSVRDSLHGLIAPQVGSTHKPIEVLSTVLNLVGEGDPLIAVVLSKFDSLQELRRIPNQPIAQIMGNAGAAVMRDPSPDVICDVNDITLVHHEVRGLLTILGAGNLVKAVENPARGRPFQHRFLAASSLGGATNGRRLAEEGIAPFRCLDPLAWALAAKGALA